MLMERRGLSFRLRAAMRSTSISRMMPGTSSIPARPGRHWQTLPCTTAGVRIWVENKVNFADSANLLTAAITLVLGTGDFTLGFGRFELGGIGTATFGAILLHALLRRGRRGLTAR